MYIYDANLLVENYYRFINKWDIESKQKLIKKLTNPIEIETEEKYDFSSSFGAWIDNRDVEEIIDDIYQARVNSREVEKF